jgi:hypothetical protein
MTSPMCKHHQQTYEAVFRHPIAHNLQRYNVTAMLRELAEVSEESNGDLKVTRNGQILVLHPSPLRNILDVEEVRTIRLFLERSNGSAIEPAKVVGEIREERVLSTR